MEKECLWGKLIDNGEVLEGDDGREYWLFCGNGERVEYNFHVLRNLGFKRVAIRQKGQTLVISTND